MLEDVFRGCIQGLYSRDVFRGCVQFGSRKSLSLVANVSINDQLGTSNNQST